MKFQRHAVLLRFFLAGLANTLWGFSVYAACILLKAEVWLALAIGMLAGIIFNFLSMGAFVFRDLVLARLPRFILSYGFLFSINIVGLNIINRWITDEIFAQLILTPPMAILSYFILSRLVFTKVEGS